MYIINISCKKKKMFRKTVMNGERICLISKQCTCNWKKKNTCTPERVGEEEVERTKSEEGDAATWCGGSKNNLT